ncbi:hypothetical protein Bbelb_126430 [Branchiostoma belcheri]|nr:hypothetical protein Bbelb_126430 [Branchiostoma belcheri]
MAFVFRPTWKQKPMEGTQGGVYGKQSCCQARPEAFFPPGSGEQRKRKACMQALKTGRNHCYYMLLTTLFRARGQLGSNLEVIVIPVVLWLCQHRRNNSILAISLRKRMFQMKAQTLPLARVCVGVPLPRQVFLKDRRQAASNRAAGSM